MKSLLSFLNEAYYKRATLGSWGEMFEQIICNAWNSKGTSIGDEFEVQATAHGIKDTAKLAQDIYKNLGRFIKDENVTLMKLETKDPVTKEWEELGQFKAYKPSNVPKTDIISSDGKYKFSVKENGKSQLMSAKINEAIATLRAAIRKEGPKELQDACEVIFTELLGRKSDSYIKGTVSKIHDKILKAGDDLSKYDKSMLIVKEIDETKDILKGLVDKLKEYPDVIEAIIREAGTGATKFGENSDSCPNYYLIWDKKGHIYVYTADEYFKKFSNTYYLRASYISQRGKYSSSMQTGVALRVDKKDY